MAKNSSPAYACTACGAPSLRWAGRCTRCGEFGTVVERAPEPTGRGTTAGRPTRPARPVTELTATAQRRLSSGLDEFDRVLGGGLVPGQVVLLAGEPGVGKSTLLLEVAQSIASRGECCLYISGEESSEQIGVRARRIGADAGTLLVADESELPAVVGHLEEHEPALLVIDSVQTISSPQVDGRAGGVAQVLEVTQALVRLAKGRGMPLIVIGQSTRENTIAGPRAMEHLVDTVLAFEGDRSTSLRLLRAVKNRYGAADEVVCFEQTAEGLREVPDPSELFRGHRDRPVAGTCTTVTLEGRRPLVSELQALVESSSVPTPRRGVTGLDTSRTSMLLAVTNQASDLGLSSKEVFVATAGGVRLADSAADLALCLAVASAAVKRALPGDFAAIGEVALSGDVRPVPMLAERVAEAARLGFRTLMVPPLRRGRLTAPAGVELVEVRHLTAAMLELANRGRTPLGVLEGGAAASRG
ncbi:MAG: repair protein RadA [Actinomycetota bacterium]